MVWRIPHSIIGISADISDNGFMIMLFEEEGDETEGGSLTS